MLCHSHVVYTMPIAVMFLALMWSAVAGDRASQPKDWRYKSSDPVNYENPVKRVINVLTKMKEDLTDEAETDAKMYDKQVCWCETNRKEKIRAVETGAAKEQNLKAEIEEGTSKQLRLQGEIEAAKASRTETQEAIKEAAGLRKKEHEQHFELEKSLGKSITSLKNALVMLSKYNNFQQMPQTVQLSMKTVLRDVAMKYELLTGDRDLDRVAGAHAGSSPLARRVRTAFLGVTSETQRANSELLAAIDVNGPGMSGNLPMEYAERLLAKAAQETGFKSPAVTFLQVDNGESYKPKSGAVFEALQNMLKDMDTQLKEAREKEAKAKKVHEELAQAKEAELQAILEGLDEYQGQEASNGRELAQAKKDLTETSDTKAADVKFLKELKTTCEDFAADYKQLSHARSEELKAVTQAVAILSEDDSREHLVNTVSLVQTRAETHLNAVAWLRRSRAAEALRLAGSGDDESDDLLAAWHGRHIRPSDRFSQESPRHTVLELLAMKVQLEPMPEVTKAMDEMIADLKGEQGEEVKQKASCQERAQSNKLDHMDTLSKADDLKATLESMDLEASTISKDIKHAEEEKINLAARVDEAAKIRNASKEEARMTEILQKKTQDLMYFSLEKLKTFYKRSETYVDAPEGYEKHSGSSAVMEMMQQIIDDSEKLVADTKKAEATDEAEFTALKEKSLELDLALQNTVTTKQEELSKLRQSRAATATQLESTQLTIKSLEDGKDALENECGFLMKNFELRQQARLKEIEGLQGAKAILLGAK